MKIPAFSNHVNMCVKNEALLKKVRVWRSWQRNPGTPLPKLPLSPLPDLKYWRNIRFTFVAENMEMKLPAWIITWTLVWKTIRFWTLFEARYQSYLSCWCTTAAMLMQIMFKASINSSWPPSSVTVVHWIALLTAGMTSAPHLKQTRVIHHFAGKVTTI